MNSEGERHILTTASSPEGWDWGKLDASRPRRATEYVGQSEVSRIAIERLRPSDTPADSKWKLTREIPIIVVDTLDSYWAFERIINKLHSFGRTNEEAKSELVGKLAGHLQLLSSLESPKMAPVLKLELEFLRAVLRPIDSPGL